MRWNSVLPEKTLLPKAGCSVAGMSIKNIGSGILALA